MLVFVDVTNFTTSGDGASLSTTHIGAGINKTFDE